MIHQQKQALENFKNYVAIKFQLYNSLFTSLPFHRIEKTGILLSLFQNNCEEGYKKKWSPVQIVDDFFTRVATFKTEQEQLDLLFRFTQYVERQIVLFDALEDAAFKEVHDMQGMGTMKQLETEVDEADLEEQLVERLNDTSIRLVLTAHPTQFYPGTVLGIINDLAKGLKDNNTIAINTYLQQLGKTPFLNKQRPTPYDEAVSLIWYLENVFYYAAGRIVNFFKRRFNHSFGIENKIISLGFWPGGDRDGNPNVTSDITLKVAEALRSSIIKCYYLDVRKLKRRLTFKGIDVLLSNLEKKLYNNIFIPGQITELSVEEILKDLNEIREIVVYQHNGLFVDLLDSLITKVELFGLHFAALDVRQDSGVHNMVLEAIAEKETCLPKNYAELSDEEKMEVLLNVEGNVNPSLYEDALIKDSLLSFRSIATIQKLNGEPGCNRYIISHCNSALNMLEVYALFLLNGWNKEALTIDIIPLFETINDLKEAAGVMRQLYENHTYREHLRRRHNKQVIMVGFSDGTKDGGYLMANWSIYKAKEELSALADEYEIEVAFFDGRGGPPARGGGKTHKFYASMGRNISQKEIQLTIQGQTISSNFGTIDSAQYNIEQLLNAGISNSLFSVRKKTVTDEEEALLQEMADLGYESYKQLKENPYFIQYLEQVSPLNFYMETNIGSRPAKRNKAQLNLDNLRAIPFVGAWSQLKQNVPGFYGVGTALRKLEEEGKFPQLKRMYQTSMFFETLIDNCEMAMKKCFFPLTAYLADHPQYGEIWTAIFEEFELTQQYIFKLTGNNELMSNYPVEQMSIQMRERIVLPLNTIQQYAISRLREAEKKPSAPLKEVYEKLIIRSSFGIINAARNSA
jgi:phosphoenolpyruvate carboxylase